MTSAQGAVPSNVSLTVDNGSPVSPPLSDGSTIFSINGLGGGTHSLSASFPAQNGFAASSAVGSLQVNQAEPTVRFTGAPAQRLDDLIACIKSKPGVWFTTGSQIHPIPEATAASQLARGAVPGRLPVS